MRWPATRPAATRCSAELFATTDAIAAQCWTEDEIGDLLLRLSHSMADEVDALAALAPQFPV